MADDAGEWGATGDLTGVGVDQHELVGIARGDGDGAGDRVDDDAFGRRPDRDDPAGHLRVLRRGRLLRFAGGGSPSAGGRVPSVGTPGGSIPVVVGVRGSSRRRRLGGGLLGAADFLAAAASDQKHQNEQQPIDHVEVYPGKGGCDRLRRHRKKSDTRRPDVALPGTSC